MNLRPSAAKGTAEGAVEALAVTGSPAASPLPAVPISSENSERCITLLMEEAARHTPEIDGDAYKAFRAKVSELALRVPDRLPEPDKLALMKEVLREFERYGTLAETALRDRRAAWRSLTGKLFRDLLAALGIEPSSAAAAPLVRRIEAIDAAVEITSFQSTLNEFLHPRGAGGNLDYASALKIADHSTANDNAAGLPGGGSAVKHLEQIMERAGTGFVVVFRLSCLDLISQRFGMEAVQDSLMAVSAYLTEGLRGDDAIYHWSDSSLLAILQSRMNEEALNIDLRRIAAYNRDIVIKVGGRAVLLRVPLDFEITPISRLTCAADLNKLAPEPAPMH